MPDYRELLGAFRDETQLDARAAARVRARMERPTLTYGWVGGGLAIGLAAALALFALTRPPVPVSGPLMTGPLTSRVAVSVADGGAGVASGTTDDLHLSLERGALSVEVEPNQGVHLAVQTDEATVSVIGTGFTVTRDAMGTSVQVRHGRVAVDCAASLHPESAHTLLGAGEGRTCPPRSAAGRLGRVRALQDAGTAPDALLAEVTDALALPDATGAVAAELGAVQLDALLALGRDEEALLLAERLAAQGGPRALDHHRVAARLRLRHPGGPDCAGALPHLKALEAAGRLDADAPWLKTCSPEAP